MKRREFIALLSGPAVAWPLGASAQQAAKLPRIGYLSGNLAATPCQRHSVKDCVTFGYVEGRNLEIEYRDVSISRPPRR